MKARREFLIIKKETLKSNYYRFELCSRDCDLSAITPGQFVEILSPGNSVLLRRPISIHDVNQESDSISLLIRAVGKGTEIICSLNEGDSLDIILPLGKGFSSDFNKDANILLIGGGVGIAPLFYQARYLSRKGVNVHLIYGARSADEIVVSDHFAKYCNIEVTTDDGSLGTRGNVLQSRFLKENSTRFDMVQCCGPLPMMKAVSEYCKAKHIPCEVSLENRMACGLGACLCCVEATKKGNQCVCVEGPVFNINELKW